MPSKDGGFVGTFGGFGCQGEMKIKQKIDKKSLGEFDRMGYVGPHQIWVRWVSRRIHPEEASGSAELP